MAPVDSMVTVPPVGTAMGATSKPSTMGLSVVFPSGMKLCPPNIPMSFREPSWSLYCESGGPLSMQGESEARVKSPLSLSVNFGSPSTLFRSTTPPPTLFDEFQNKLFSTITPDAGAHMGRFPMPLLLQLQFQSAFPIILVPLDDSTRIPIPTLELFPL